MLNCNHSDKNFSEIVVACYGGLFFHKDIISKIGLPDENYFLYMDDFEYTYRNCLNGGKIYFVHDSIVLDQEKSWNNNKSLAILQIVKNKNFSTLYYSIRNRVYFELKYTVDNYFMYTINSFIYSFLIILLCVIYFRYYNIYVYLKALIDGFTKNMGYNPKFTLQ